MCSLPDDIRDHEYYLWTCDGEPLLQGWLRIPAIAVTLWRRKPVRSSYLEAQVLVLDRIEAGRAGRRRRDRRRQ